jgi:hypothetical protein
MIRNRLNGVYLSEYTTTRKKWSGHSSVVAAAKQ